MTVLPENIEPGLCYLLTTGHVRCVTRVIPDRSIQDEYRMRHSVKNRKTNIQEGRSFAVAVEREVPCDRTPEVDEA